jgi:hypothetical protein
LTSPLCRKRQWRMRRKRGVMWWQKPSERLIFRPGIRIGSPRDKTVSDYTQSEQAGMPN